MCESRKVNGERSVKSIGKVLLQLEIGKNWTSSLISGTIYMWGLERERGREREKYV